MTYVKEIRLRHFAERMRRRLGIECTPEILAEIVRQIQSHESIPVSRRGKRRTVHLVNLEGVEFYVVYSIAHHIPFTCYAVDHHNLSWRYPQEKIDARRQKEECR